MKAVLLEGPRRLRLGEAPDPTPGPHEVAIRVHTTGICGSDLHVYTGDRPVAYPRILGHEFAGDTVAVGGEVSDLRPGMRVTAEPNFSCGQCFYCRAGRQNLCLNRIGLAIDVDGTLAEYVVVPERFVWPLPANVSYAQGAMVEPQMVGLHGVYRSGARAGDTVAILGCGTIGLMALLAARATGCRVLAVDVVADKLALAQQLGAEQVFQGTQPDLVRAMRHATGGLGPDIVMETAGVAATVQQAIALVRPAGRVVLLGLSTKPAALAPIDIARREVEVFGSFIYRADEFGRALRLIAEGQVDVRPLVGLTARLADTAAAFEEALSGHVVKALVEV